ncbi:hypothetical protein [Mesomycoplasma bovoculi]|uniref:Transmembrane protein n=1 Tax=Mesomycoplasma bovoculi M165/69 TaxID=743966 RepID=W5UTY3_9BACT|nr:hypothetical protein [Mesomycoplasma bovoculi]AHH45556.1 hypothetical protein MYB_02785 [Mesomycoplasma bovoculi M165/69]
MNLEEYKKFNKSQKDKVQKNTFIFVVIAIIAFTVFAVMLAFYILISSAHQFQDDFLEPTWLSITSLLCLLGIVGVIGIIFGLIKLRVLKKELKSIVDEIQLYKFTNS